MTSVRNYHASRSTSTIPPKLATYLPNRWLYLKHCRRPLEITLLCLKSSALAIKTGHSVCMNWCLYCIMCEWFPYTRQQTIVSVYFRYFTTKSFGRIQFPHFQRHFTARVRGAMFSLAGSIWAELSIRHVLPQSDSPEPVSYLWIRF